MTGVLLYDVHEVKVVNEVAHSPTATYARL